MNFIPSKYLSMGKLVFLIKAQSNFLLKAQFRPEGPENTPKLDQKKNEDK